MNGSRLDTRSVVRAIYLTHDVIDTANLVRAVTDPSAGAVVVFEGVTRDVPLLRFEAHEEMASKLLRRYADTAAAQFDLTGVAIVHRLGDVPLGKASIVIAVSSGHRPDAFGASRFLIDAIKIDVPIWKQEIIGSVARWGISECDPTTVVRTTGER